MFQIGSGCGATPQTNQTPGASSTPCQPTKKPAVELEHKGTGSPIHSARRDMRLESRTCSAALTRGLQRTSQPISVNVSVFRNFWQSFVIGQVPREIPLLVDKPRRERSVFHESGIRWAARTGMKVRQPARESNEFEQLTMFEMTKHVPSVDRLSIRLSCTI
jgi:hypothetical protein